MNWRVLLCKDYESKRKWSIFHTHPFSKIIPSFSFHQAAAVPVTPAGRPAQDRQSSLGQPQVQRQEGMCVSPPPCSWARQWLRAVTHRYQRHLLRPRQPPQQGRRCRVAACHGLPGRGITIGTNLTSINWLHKWALVVLSSMFLLFQLYSKITSSSLQLREIIITAYAFICTYNYNKLLALIGLWKIYVWPLQKSKHSCSGYYIIITTKGNSWNLMI